MRIAGVGGLGGIAAVQVATGLAVLTSLATAKEHLVGADYPLKTIQAAAEVAQPGDTITVHSGVYRERVNPPRGGHSDVERITYQAAPGEEVVITGADVFKTWQRVEGNVWKLVLSNSHFGGFNPYVEKVHGDWFDGRGRTHRRGMVYLNGEWLPEARNKDAVAVSGGEPMWHASVDGSPDDSPGFLVNIVSIKPSGGTPVAAAAAAARGGTVNAVCSEGGQCVGFITQGCWLRYNGVDFGNGTESVVIRAAAVSGAGGVVDLRDGHFDGPLLGTCEIQPTGDWQKWADFTAKINKTDGKRDLFLVFRSLAPAKAPVASGADARTIITARFPSGVDPNKGSVEVCVRPTVFTPEKTNVDFITVRGFKLRNAATNWAAPTAGQVGLVTAYWSKGWIIENNEISYSRCCGIALGKYSDEWDGRRGSTEGYYLTIDDAFRKAGWSKENIGGHIVRNNHVHHCGQTGIVGSLGCAFSRIVGNDIHDCNMQGIWGGAEMAGIKFHGAIDTVIADNHIHHNGNAGGLWLDWMAQGTQVTGNLFHDNQTQDLFLEVNHGPILVANNLFLSPMMQGYGWGGSQGVAYVHNLVAGGLCRFHPEKRRTPVMEPHSTRPVSLDREENPVGDVRWHHNFLTGEFSLTSYDAATLGVVADGNVFVGRAKVSKSDANTVADPGFDPGVKLERRADGWFLSLAAEPKWRDAVDRKFASTRLLGNAVIPGQPFTHPDGSPLVVDTDYFGRKRVAGSPFPGPFEVVTAGISTYKVWPKP